MTASGSNLKNPTVDLPYIQTNINATSPWLYDVLKICDHIDIER